MLYSNKKIPLCIVNLPMISQFLSSTILRQLTKCLMLHSGLLKQTVLIYLNVRKPFCVERKLMVLLNFLQFIISNGLILLNFLLCISIDFCHSAVTLIMLCQKLTSDFIFWNSFSCEVSMQIIWVLFLLHSFYPSNCMLLTLFMPIFEIMILIGYSQC